MLKNKWIVAAMMLATLFMVACNAVKTKTKSDTDKGVVTTISMPATVKNGDQVRLSMEVKNNGNADCRFLKWNSPFEPAFLGDYLHITDEKGEKVSYRGAMAKRMWPPPEDAYLTLRPGGSLKAEIVISQAYDITKPGDYTIKFQGQEGEGALSNSNSVNFKVK